MKVSIIIPYKQDRGYLKDAILSAENQTGFTLGVDYEIILSKGDHYLGKNVNDGVKRAKGKYIKNLAEDDLLENNCLMDLYTKAEEGYDLVCADSVSFDQTGITDMVKSEIPRTVHELAMLNTLHGGTILYRKDTMPLWDEAMWTAEEYEVSLRMAAAGLRFGYVPKVVYLYRRHKAQKSGGGKTPWIKCPDGVTYRFEYIENLQSQFIGNNFLISR